MDEVTDPKYVSHYTFIIIVCNFSKNNLQTGPKYVIHKIIHKFTLFCWQLKSKVCSEWKINKVILKLLLKMLENYRLILKMWLKHSKRRRKLTGMEDLESLHQNGKTFVRRSICPFLELVFSKKQYWEFKHHQLNSQIVINHMFIFAGTPSVANMQFPC